MDMRPLEAVNICHYLTRRNKIPGIKVANQPTLRWGDFQVRATQSLRAWLLKGWSRDVVGKQARNIRLVTLRVEGAHKPRNAEKKQDRQNEVSSVV